MNNVFTSRNNNKNFRSLQNNHDCSVIQRIDLRLNYGNLEIINFIDASYVKTFNSKILEELRSILELVYIISSRFANIY